MKTGVAIALAIGVPATIGIVAWAIMANKIIDNVGGGKVPVPPPPGAPSLPPGVSIVTAPGGETAVAISGMRPLLTWARQEVAAGRIMPTENAYAVVQRIVSKIPGYDAATLTGILVTEMGSAAADEWSDVESNLSKMTVGQVLTKADAALKEKGL
jgi:hypothetical protein